MMGGINNSPNGVLVTNVTYNGNHSAANSDDGESNSRTNLESVYSGTALFTPNSAPTAASSSIIHPIQAYESVLHPTAGRYVIHFGFFC